jgi:hypothetical protein
VGWLPMCWNTNHDMPLVIISYFVSGTSPFASANGSSLPQGEVSELDDSDL